MCALIILQDRVEGYPLVVGANRDEYYARPFSRPRIITHQGTRILAPRDEQAGGTWIGLNEHGLFAAITNLIQGQHDPGARSRGQLMLDILAASSVVRAREWLAGELPTSRYNSFQLFLSDGKTGGVLPFISPDSRGRWLELQPGVHLLTNEHGLNELEIPGLDKIFDGSPAVEESIRRMKTRLADHEDRSGHFLCKHFEKRGTVSSAVIALSGEAKGPHQFHFAPGPPCKSAFQEDHPSP